MRYATTAWILSLILLSLTFAGCASLSTGGAKEVGILRVSGPNVWLNNERGNDGDRILIGSTVGTGAGSSAMVEFRGGGYLQIDQDTDPVFGWIEQSKCILIRIFRGQAYLKRERACVEGPDISLVLNSEANIRIAPEPRLAEVTLVKGSVDVTAPGGPIRLEPGQQFTVTEGRTSSLRALSRRELNAVVGWRSAYRFRPLPGPEPVPFPTGFPPARHDRHRETPTSPKPPTVPGTSEPAPPKPPTVPDTPEPAPPSTSPVIDRGIRVPSDVIIKPPGSDIR